jgi:hypothetical protein
MVRAITMTSKHVTRIEFLKLGAGFVSLGALPFTFGCPGDDTGDEGAETANVSTGPDPSTGSTGGTTETPGTTTDMPGTTTEPETSTGPSADSSSSGMPGSSSEGETSAGACTMDPDVMIGTNHGHELVVPLADVMAGVEVMYGIQGTSMHSHTVTLTAEHFMMLQQGMQVVVESSTDAMHSHSVTVSCG